MKMAWLTDIHLNFINQTERKIFYQKIIKNNYPCVLISGDIAEAPSLSSLLQEMAREISKPIYFVLGNHDYYQASIKKVREAMALLTKTHSQLFWLPASGMQALTKDTILLGQDGWADGRLGNYQGSHVTLNDSRMIVDLFQAKILGKNSLLDKMQKFADKDAKQLENDLLLAIEQFPKRIIVLTHVPPYKEACLYEGQISDENWLPYFSSKVMGDVLLEVAQKHSAIEFLVLCGHTHNRAHYQPLQNLTVKVGNAEYYYPEIQEVI